MDDDIRILSGDVQHRGGFVYSMASNLLKKDADGEAVLKEMRNHYTTACSLSKHMSLVRSNALDRLTMKTVHSQYAPTIAAFRAALTGASVSAQTREMGDKFLSSNFHVQYAMHRAHRSGKYSYSDSEVDAAMERIRILPQAFDSFHIGRTNAQTCRRAATEMQLHKHETRLVVPDATELLRRCQSYLSVVHALPLSEIDLPRLICALMLVSGRRLTEICNGRSTFTRKGPSQARFASLMSCMFEGQLKKRESVPITSETVASAVSNDGEFQIDKSAYAIPLLIESSTFFRAYAKLRQHQIYRSKARLDVTLVSEQQVAERYSNSVNAYAREDMGMRRSHDLRATYATMVFVAFKVPDAISFNRLTMRVLGHENILVSLQYAHIALKGFEAFEGAFGKLPIDIETAH